MIFYLFRRSEAFESVNITNLVLSILVFLSLEDFEGARPTNLVLNMLLCPNSTNSVFIDYV